MPFMKSKDLYIVEIYISYLHSKGESDVMVLLIGVEIKP
jgi:hypothetical protein